jgi:hypothetical protein
MERTRKPTKTLLLLVSALAIAACGAGQSVRQEPRAPGSGAANKGGIEGSEMGQYPCIKTAQDGRRLIRKECIHADVDVPDGLRLADLKNVTIATFEVVGTATYPDTGEVLAWEQHDNQSKSFGVTDAFAGRLVANGLSLVTRNRDVTDHILKELELSTSKLMDEDSAPAIAGMLGANTLIVGRYRFAGCFELRRGAGADVYLGPAKSVALQSIEVKAFDVSKGKVLFNARFSMTGRTSEKLTPRLLARYAAKVLMAKFWQAGERF